MIKPIVVGKNYKATREILIHQILYEYADRLINKKACDITNGECRLHKEKIASRKNCCSQYNCKYVSKNGCTTRCLNCKLYLCHMLKSRLPILYGNLLRLKQIWNLYYPNHTHNYFKPEVPTQ